MVRDKSCIVRDRSRRMVRDISCTVRDRIRRMVRAGAVRLEKSGGCLEHELYG